DGGGRRGVVDHERRSAPARGTGAPEAGEDSGACAMKRDDVRRAFRKAEGDDAPAIEPLVEAVPSLMAEAGRRGVSAPAAAPWWPAVPRLAVLTGVAVVVACALMVTGKDGSSTPSAFERVMLGTGGSGSTGDLLLDAVLDAGRDDG